VSPAADIISTMSVLFLEELFSRTKSPKEMAALTASSICYSSIFIFFSL
jgi:hypothetical protein